MRGTYSSGSSTVRGSILGDGLVAAQQPAANSGTAVVWQGLHGTSQTSKITADGSATFSGGNFIISSGGTILADNGGNPASAAKVNINSNGAATFAGTIKSGALDLSNTSAAGIEVRSTGRNFTTTTIFSEHKAHLSMVAWETLKMSISLVMALHPLDKRQTQLTTMAFCWRCRRCWSI